MEASVSLQEKIRSAVSNLGPTADGLSSAYLDLNLDDADLADDDLVVIARNKYLQNIKLAGNRLTTLGPLGDLHFMIKLLAPRNQLTVALDLSHPNRNLRCVDLSDNRIASLPDLSGFMSLRVLLLRGNLLDSCRGLNVLHGLQELDLANNRLESLDGLEGLAKLERLEVSSNAITSLGPCFELPLLRAISAAGNRLASLDGLGTQPFLEEVNVSHNVIANRGAVTPLTWLPMLRRAALAGNGVMDWPSPDVARLELLRLLPSLLALDGAAVTPVDKTAAANWGGADLAPLARIRRGHFPEGELDDGGGASRPRTPAPSEADAFAAWVLGQGLESVDHGLESTDAGLASQNHGLESLARRLLPGLARHGACGADGGGAAESVILARLVALRPPGDLKRLTRRELRELYHGVADDETAARAAAEAAARPEVVVHIGRIREGETRAVLRPGSATPLT